MQGKLQAVKPSGPVWKSSLNSVRTEEVTVTCLHTGLTHLLHSDIHLVCPHCGASVTIPTLWLNAYFIMKNIVCFISTVECTETLAGIIVMCL
jgi:hypothetical protein